MTDNECFFVKGRKCEKGNDRCIYALNTQCRIKEKELEMTECKEYGLKCLKCPFWNKYSNYCTKFRIWSESQ